MTETEKIKIMKIKTYYFLGLIVLVITFTSGFSSFETHKVKGFHVEQDEKIVYNVPTENEGSGIKKLTLFNFFNSTKTTKKSTSAKSFEKFGLLLAIRESGNVLNKVNPFGYMGKYQFGKSTLRSVGVYDFEEFLRNEKWQEEAFIALLSRNKWELRKEIKEYAGRIINGIEITESGLLAAAHLGGASSVRKFLKSNGESGFNDGFGTSLESYIVKFGGFSVQHIKAKSNAKVNLELN